VGALNETILEDSTKYFWLSSGAGLRSIRELANTLPSMPVDVFSYHVNSEKNDFANWIEGVFHEPELATRLRNCQSKQDFQTVLYNAFIRREIREFKAKNAEHKAEEEQHVKEDAAAFATYRAEDAKRKDALADRFDAMARRFTEDAKPLTPERVLKRIEAITELYRDVRQRITDARKAGKDPLIADLTLRPVPAKLEYCRLTHEEKDFQQVEAIIHEAERELAEELETQAPNAKQDVMRMMAGGAQSAVSGVQNAVGGSGGGR